ncbi:MAG: isoprenylcysteine carboxylmethyltransferase family protein [Acidobacteriia bacterium]|nr:isoprenylcysteine carboxylmethyltransferase family protein [Terriglobia bacterium]
MRATDFEFRYRFFVIVLIYGLGFLFNVFDPVNVSAAVIQALARSRLEFDFNPARLWLQLAFLGGSTLIFVGAGIRTWATAYLKAEVVHDSQLHSEGLVVDGPFRHVRNPLYLSNIFLALGMGTLASRAGFVFIVAVNTLFVFRLIWREEAELLAQQGESFRRFCAAVPRLWPSFTPRWPSSAIRPEWGQAFGAEVLFWVFGAALLSFAVTLRMTIFYAILISAFVFDLMAYLLIKRTRIKKSKVVQKSGNTAREQHTDQNVG